MERIDVSFPSGTVNCAAWLYRPTHAAGGCPRHRAVEHHPLHPANLLAVDGRANQDRGDAEPADGMPPNHAFWCQYSVQFAAVLRGYALPIDERSSVVLRDAAATCPDGLSGGRHHARTRCGRRTLVRV